VSRRKLRAGYHAWRTYPAHRGRDGANFAYEEIGRLLQSTFALVARPHDILELCKDDRLAFNELRDIDVVVACVGPHAYLYFYLRQRLCLDFRIIRDARTALWNAYFLQEALVQPLMRESDLLVHSSAYSQAVYSRAFPGLNSTNQAVCYPLTRWFPQKMPRAPRNSWQRVTLGFVGRMTDDKGYPQALELFAACRRYWPGRYQMLSVGEVLNLGHHEKLLYKHLGADRSGYRSLGPVVRNEIWQMYDQMDLLLFPSTSNLETFGRVLVEASHAGVPILAAGHGAAHELIDPAAKVPVIYRHGELISLRDSVAMGSLDLDAAVGALADTTAVPRSTGHELYKSDDELFLHLVKVGISAARTDRAVRTEQAAFAALLTLQDLPTLTEQQVLVQIEKLVKMIVALHDWYSFRYYKALIRLIMASSMRHRTVQFVRRSVHWREDLTNIGGMDMEFAHLLLFAPSYRLDGGDSE